MRLKTRDTRTHTFTLCLLGQSSVCGGGINNGIQSLFRLMFQNRSDDVPPAPQSLACAQPLRADLLAHAVP